MSETQRISPAEAAKLLSKSRNTIMALIEARELPATDERRPGAARPFYRIDPADLTLWRERRQVTAARTDQRARTMPVNGTLGRMLEKRKRDQERRGKVPMGSR